MFRLKVSQLQALTTFSLPDALPALGKHVALFKNKIDCADVYCVTLIELKTHRDAFIQNISEIFWGNSSFVKFW